MADELILGLPRERILGGDEWRGIRSGNVQPYLDIIATEAHARPRTEAEQDPAWKQVIPYLLMRDGERIFLMRRTRAGGDARLHERWSIGIGGHLNPEDGDLHGGLLREFAEEMRADWAPEPKLVGLLNDDSTPVGQVHLGVVYAADARGRELSIRETEKLSGEFVLPDEVRSGYDRLETWSQLLFDHISESEGSDKAT